MRKDDSISKMLDFYMGKNTPNRQQFIIGNLRVEEDRVDADDEILESGRRAGNKVGTLTNEAMPEAS